MRSFLRLALSLPAYASSAIAQLAPITFPADGGIVDVREYGAVPDDEGDDTAAIQSALDAYPNGNRIVYLPPGVFVVRDTLRWPAGDGGGNAQKRTILQGAGEPLSIIRLPQNTGGFNDGARPKPLIWTGGAPAQRFRNAVRDLTIEIGPQNAGAIGLQFNASNQGTIRNVSIRAGDGSGKTGLDLGHCDEIGPLLVRHLTVEGFEVGISTKWPVNSNTFEHLVLRKQRRLGWWNYHQMVFVRDLVSENRVPSIFNEKDSWGSVTLLDAHLHAINPDRNTPAILNQRQFYLRNVEVLGYGLAVDNDDKGRDKGDISPEGILKEDTSHKNVRSLFREVGDGTLARSGEIAQLPVKETPEVPWGDPVREWANLIDFGADPTGAADASPALQKAIDSGSKTLYLPAGANFLFSSAVEIRGPVQRIIGLEGRFTAEGAPIWKLVDGRHPQKLPDAPVVIIERMSHQSGGAEIRVLHESARTLVISSATGFAIEGVGKGDLFLDDLCGHLDRLAPGQSAWCRQLNSEREGLKCRNAGGKLWILGMKTEKTGTLIDTTAGGITELNGLFVFSNSGWNEGEAAFTVADATLNLFGVNERNFNRQPVKLWVRERQGAETRELAEMPWVFLGR
ncbi:MAG: hypothetical protein B9S36_04405 [Verrucomicrobiia bacterium Tous-C2TDCM]|nr:MAG: hypothetical protein B9S36_04405 [Verrucomicrobiae bacterium Tous-C2TDCM]